MLDFDEIETPESIVLRRRLAGIGTRFIAGLVDHLLLALLFLALGVAGLLIWGWSAVAGIRWSVWTVAMLVVVAFLLYWGYFVFFELRTNGQSPGKKQSKIRVVKEGGGPIGFTDVAIRNLLRAADGMGAYLVAGLFMFLTKKCQRLGDLAGGTVVIDEAPRDYGAKPRSRPADDWERQATPQALEATGLSPEEYRVLTNFWLRRQELSWEARQGLLLKLVRPILARIGALPDPPTPTALENRLAELLRKAHLTEQSAKQAVSRPGRSGDAGQVP